MFRFIELNLFKLITYLNENIAKKTKYWIIKVIVEYLIIFIYGVYYISLRPILIINRFIYRKLFYEVLHEKLNVDLHTVILSSFLKQVFYNKHYSADHYICYKLPEILQNEFVKKLVDQRKLTPLEIGNRLLIDVDKLLFNGKLYDVESDLEMSRIVINNDSTYKMSDFFYKEMYDCDVNYAVYLQKKHEEEYKARKMYIFDVLSKFYFPVITLVVSCFALYISLNKNEFERLRNQILKNEDQIQKYHDKLNQQEVELEILKNKIQFSSYLMPVISDTNLVERQSIQTPVQAPQKQDTTKRQKNPIFQ